MYRIALILLSLMLAVACGDSKPDPKSSAGADEFEEGEEEGISIRQTYSPEKGTASISGVVPWILLRALTSVPA